MSRFRWILNDASGQPMRSTEHFDGKDAAEAWMGEHWAELLAQGAETVSLDEDGEVHYTMGLRAE